LYELLSTKATAGALKETLVFGGFTTILHLSTKEASLTLSWTEQSMPFRLFTSWRVPLSIRAPIGS
jgi:hypothetical protein